MTADSGVTVKAVGDAIFIGCARFKRNFTYVWLDTVGAGGQVQWYCSTAKGWKFRARSRSDSG